MKDLDRALQIYQNVLGLKLEGVHTVKERKVKVAFLSAGGENKFELIEPTDNESFIARFIAEHGEGIHHVAVKTSDFDAVLNDLEANGLKVQNDMPRLGIGGVRIAFVHSKDIGNVLIELREAT